jgi:hypothetical protein
MQTEENVSVGKKSTTSLILGIIGLVGWIIPIIGAPITITGLVFGIKGIIHEKKGKAYVGVTLCTIGLLLTIINASIGAYIGVQNAIEKQRNSTTTEITR